MLNSLTNQLLNKKKLHKAGKKNVQKQRLMKLLHWKLLPVFNKPTEK